MLNRRRYVFSAFHIETAAYQEIHRDSEPAQGPVRTARHPIHSFFGVGNDNEKIYVTFCGRRSPGMGAKEDDLLRMERCD